MLEELIKLDEQLFLILNGWHNVYFDSLMIFVSKTNTWLPLYGIFILLIIRKFKYQSWVVLLAIILLITVSDRFTSGFMKPFFERNRPSHEQKFEKIIHAPDGKGGQYGFASSHAANSFAIATFLFCLFSKNLSFRIFLIFWATLVSYSRIYLGVHYPADVLVGALVGIIDAILIFSFMEALRIKFQINAKTKNA